MIFFKHCWVSFLCLTSKVRHKKHGYIHLWIFQDAATHNLKCLFKKNNNCLVIPISPDKNKEEDRVLIFGLSARRLRAVVVTNGCMSASCGFIDWITTHSYPRENKLIVIHSEKQKQSGGRVGGQTKAIWTHSSWLVGTHEACGLITSVNIKSIRRSIKQCDGLETEKQTNKQ